MTTAAGSHPSIKQPIPEDVFREAVARGATWVAVGKEIGRTGVAVQKRAEHLGIDLGNKASTANPRPRGDKVSDERIRGVVPTSDNWVQAGKTLGLSPKTVRDRGKALGVLPLNGGRMGGDKTKKGQAARKAAAAAPTPPAPTEAEVLEALEEPAEGVITETVILKAEFASGFKLEVAEDYCQIVDPDGRLTMLPFDVRDTLVAMVKRLRTP